MRSQLLLGLWPIACAVFALACLLAPTASAKPTPKLSVYAQGHAYRLGVVPRRGDQLASAPRTAASTSSTSSGNLTFGGAVNGDGVTTGSPKVYVVFWGSQWGSQGSNSQGYVTLTGDPQGMAPYLQAFLNGLGTNGETWSGVMTQYCQGVITGAQTCPSSNTQHVGYPTGGALAGVWVDESTPAPQQANEAQFEAEAASAAGHFGNTTATANRDAQYVLVSPTGTNPDGFNTSSAFCAWHGYVFTSPDGPLAYTNLPYIPDAGVFCGENFVNPGPSGALDGVSIIEGHEYAETLTDPSFGGWTDQSGNETGDKCAWISSGPGAAADISLATGTFAVQSTWANDFDNGAGGCEISHPIVTNPAPRDTVTVTNPGTQTGTAGVPASLQINATDSDSTQPLTYSALALPSGLTISPSSGAITGTPHTAGSSYVTVFATDATGADGSTTFLWRRDPRSTLTSVTCTSSDLTLDTATTCTATVSDASPGDTTSPTGTVSFTAAPTSDGNFSPTATCTLTSTQTPGTASCSTTYTPTATGAQSVNAAYPGDDLHTGSAGTASLTVSALSSSTSVSCTPSAVTLGTSTTCTATVSDASSGASTSPTGTVSFTAAPASDGNFSPNATCTLTLTTTAGTASCSTTYTPTAAGSQTIYAAYQGDAVYPSSSSTTGASLTVSAPQTSPSGGAPPPSTTTTHSGSPGTGSGSTTTTNSPGSTPPANAAGPGCPAATGRLSDSTLGLVRLGMTRDQVRSAYRRSLVRSLRYQDVFCLTPTGLTVGYPSQAVMRALTASQRTQLRGRAVWATTANPRYFAGSIRAGVKFAAARRVLARANRVVIGRVVWYFLPQRAATVVVQVRSGVVREVGIASEQLTRTVGAEALLGRSLA